MTAFAMPLRWLRHGVDIWAVLTPTEVRWSVRGIAAALGDDKTAAGIADRHDVAMPSWTVATATPYIQGLIGKAPHAAQLLQWLEDQTFILESIGNEQLERLASEPAHPTDDRGHALPTVYSVQEAAEILDRDPAIVTGRDRLFDQMLRSGWIIRQGDSFRTATEAVREGLVAIQPRRIPGRDGLYPQVLLTVAGIRLMHTRLGGQAPIHFASPAYTPLEETPA